MRIALLVLAACSTTPEERLDDLESGTDVVCLDYTECQNTVKPIDDVVACLNGALTNGSTAEAKWSLYDTKMFYVTTYVFADDHRVKSFVRVPDDFGGPQTWVSENPTCTGPFRASTQQGCPNQQTLPAWDGCP